MPPAAAASSSGGAASKKDEAALAELVETVYERCLQEPADHIFTLGELQAMVPARNNAEMSQNVLNALSRSRRLAVMIQGNQTVFRIITKEQSEKVKNMTQDESLLYAYIEDAAREGIWTKTLKAKSNMHITSMNKALKSLEHKRYVKAVKSVQYPTRKIYMLYELTPSVEVSGGPWFTDQELDTEFVGELLTAIHKYIVSKSFPRPSQSTSSSSSVPVVSSFPPGHAGYPTLNQIFHWIKNAQLTDVDLAEGHIKNLLDVLVYDGRVERVVGGTAYKAVRRPEIVNGFTESPCGRCPVFNLCAEGGPVSASNCKYFEDWLNAGL